jgi:hypothetical protein
MRTSPCVHVDVRPGVWTVYPEVMGMRSQSKPMDWKSDSNVDTRHP